MPTFTNLLPAGAPVPDSAASHSSEETGTLRTSRGRFLPGRSGNASGRPRSETSALRLRLENDVESVAEVVVRKALDGDMAAARLVMERLLPPLKATSAPVAVEVTEASGPYPMAEAVLRAALAGTIPSDTAAQLVGVASQVYRIAEAEESKARFEAYKRAISNQQPNPNGTHGHELSPVPHLLIR